MIFDEYLKNKKYFINIKYKDIFLKYLIQENGMDVLFYEEYFKLAETNGEIISVSNIMWIKAIHQTLEVINKLEAINNNVEEAIK